MELRPLCVFLLMTGLIHCTQTGEEVQGGTNRETEGVTGDGEIKPETESPKPVVIIKPYTQVFREETVTFRCEIQEGGDTEWTYDWYRDNNTFNPSITAQEFIISDYDSGNYTCRGRRRSDSQISKTSDPVTLTVSEKPKPELTSSLKGPALTGNSVTLSCTLKLPSDGWKFYWTKRRQSTETETETETHSYNISPVSVYDGGQYKCRAGRGNPVYYTHYSNELRVDVIVSPKPEVIIKPHTQVYREEKVTFSCNIQGGGNTKWTYSLYKNDKENRNHTIQEFSISSVTDSDSGNYTCRGRRSSYYQISEISAPVTLTVSEKPKPTLRVNTQSPVYTGNRVTLTCNLLSTGWTFLWYKDYQESNPLSPGTTDNNTLSVTVSNEGETQYYCKARRGNYESEISDPATITVRARPKPAVKVQPAKRVFIGETVTLTCEIQTGESWRYLWYRNNKELSDAAGKKTHAITDIKESDKGDYTCNGTQSSDPKYTQTSDAVTLTVSEKPKPELTSSLKGAALTGNSVTLYCTLKPQSAGWKFFWIKPTQSTETETETHSYNISSVSVYDGGQYWCRAGRRKQVYYTDYSDELRVDVIESPKAVVIIKPDTQVFRGERVTFRCYIKGGDTEWTYDWYRYNRFYTSHTTQEIIISDYHSGKYTCRGRRRSDSQISKMSDPVTLTVSGVCVCELKPLSPGTRNTNTLSVTVSNEGETQYYCKARRGNYESEISDPATITVRVRPKPVVKVQPAKRVFIGETVTLTCEIQTGESWRYLWYRNNEELSDAAGKKTHTITDVKDSVKGDYTCKGTQSLDPEYTQTSDAVTLTVSEKPKPELTSDLKGAVLRGNSVNLSCTLKLQSAGWKFYWSNHTQSTETEAKTDFYTTTVYSSVSVSDGGQYRCRGGRGNPVYYTHYSDALWVNVTVFLPSLSHKPDSIVLRMMGSFYSQRVE
ncbi:carcinoembryonic antigen-related cell adhesion molecule 5 [Ictalurus punctatus]|uniref:Carcinoembryonic antigen-related cell adhesion molecule 5 n=1 Tax=Ictalurus punctatus TaxID=7998 RepID=A0A9F7TLJ4_ICTPU|nr:carcinoembryonic antigen-related cell adhesion molecule 5 [Ictalurus punctatus]